MSRTERHSCPRELARHDLHHAHREPAQHLSQRASRRSTTKRDEALTSTRQPSRCISRRARSPGPVQRDWSQMREKELSCGTHHPQHRAAARHHHRLLVVHAVQAFVPRQPEVGNLDDHLLVLPRQRRKQQVRRLQVPMDDRLWSNMLRSFDSFEITQVGGWCVPGPAGCRRAGSRCAGTPSPWPRPAQPSAAAPPSAATPRHLR